MTVVIFKVIQVTAKHLSMETQRETGKLSNKATIALVKEEINPEYGLLHGHTVSTVKSESRDFIPSMWQESDFFNNYKG